MSQPQSEKLYKAGLKIVKLLAQNGKAAFFVGGFVRNDLLKLPSDNLDIATEATPDEVEQILDRIGIKNKPVGKQFGSILAIVNNFKIEITTFRSESEYGDNRHPDRVEFIKEYLDDAKRRDFTINALYFDPITQKTFDPTNGLKDLKTKLLKFVGEPKNRITEDPLRMLRGVRLATQLGFKLEKKSLAAIKALAKQIETVSGERIKAELDKILLSENRVAGLKLLDQTGLIKFIIPETQKLKTVRHKSKNHHLEGDVLTHTYMALGLLQKSVNLELLYATLFHDIGKVIKPTPVYKDNESRLSFIGHIKLSEEIFLAFAQKYRFPKNQKQTIAWLISRHDDREKFISWNELRQLEYLMVSNIDLLMEVWRVDSVANLRLIDGKPASRESRAYVLAKKLVSKILSTQKLVDHLAKGDLIMKFGKLKPGRELGQKILDVKVQIVLGKIKNESDLKTFLKNSGKNT